MASAVDVELAQIEAEIARLTVIRDYLRTRSNGAARPVRRRGPRPKGAMTAAAAAEKVLAKRGEPMRTPDLLVAIRKEGASLKDADSLYKTLSRSDRFRKAGRGLWTLA